MNLHCEYIFITVDLSLRWLLPKCSADVDINSNALVDTMVSKASNVTTH